MAWFDCAVRQPINANTGGITSAYNGLVLHHAVSNASSLQPLFGTPGFGASAHFYVRQDGEIQQYVDTGVVAWAQGNSTGNATMTSVETQGCATPPYADPMSSAMIDGLARLYAEGNARYGWPFALAETQGAHGFSYHRLWNNTACPCQVRVDDRASILQQAQGPTPPVGGDVAVTEVFDFKANQLDLVQVAPNGQLLHKWNDGKGWNTENMGVPGVNFAGQPEVAIIGGACWVSVEDSSGNAWTFLQEQSSGTWQNSKLP